MFHLFPPLNYFGAYTQSGEPCAYPSITAKYWPGLRLWVRETWGITGFWYRPSIGKDDPKYFFSVKYKADDFKKENIRVDKATWDKYYNKAVWESRETMKLILKWQPSIFTLRPVSRITLEVVTVTIERLHELDDIDAAMEGCKNREEFIQVWDALNKKRGFPWAANPWVYRIQFKRHDT